MVYDSSIVGAEHVLACVHRVADWSLCSLAGFGWSCIFVAWGDCDGWPLSAFVWPGVLWWYAVSRRSISSMRSIIFRCWLRIKTCIWFADILFSMFSILSVILVSISMILFSTLVYAAGPACCCRLQLVLLFAHFLLPLLQNSSPAAQLTFFPFNLPFHGQDVGTLMSFKGWLLGLLVVGSGISTCRIFSRCFCCFCDVVLLRHCFISVQRCAACEYHVIRTRFDDTHLCTSFSARLELSGLW